MTHQSFEQRPFDGGLAREGLRLQIQTIAGQRLRAVGRRIGRWNHAAQQRRAARALRRLMPSAIDGPNDDWER